MRRLLLAALLLAVPAVPASASPAECVATSSLPVCAGTCRAGETISVTSVGAFAHGTANCGGAAASCSAFRGSCTDTATATSSGPLTCTLESGSGVAYCDVKIAST
jgi:hypothetical protein